MKEHPYIRLGQTLARVPFLKHIDDAGIDEMLLKSVILECDPGDVLIEEAAKDSDFFVLLKGSLRVMRSGQEVALVDKPGELVGEQALATGEPRTASVQAGERSFCLKVSPKILETMSEEQRDVYLRELYRFLVEILGDRLAATSHRLAEVERELEGLKREG